MKFEHTPKNIGNQLKGVGIGVGLGLGIMGTALGISHELKKERPELVSLDKKNKLEQVYAGFDPETREELGRLQGHYIQIYQDQHKDAKIDSGVLAKHFQEMITNYGSKIKIEPNVHDSRAHHDGHIISYAKENVKDSAYFEKMHLPVRPLESSNLEDFIAEMSHEINNDQSFGRKVKEIEEGADETHAYIDPSRLEYQAHQITEEILTDWLFNDPSALESASFEKMYNYVWTKYPLVDKKLDWLDYKKQLFDSYYQGLKEGKK